MFVTGTFEKPLMRIQDPEWKNSDPGSGMEKVPYNGV
jgi:hypothetical protein